MVAPELTCVIYEMVGERVVFSMSVRKYLLYILYILTSESVCLYHLLRVRGLVPTPLCASGKSALTAQRIRSAGSPINCG